MPEPGMTSLGAQSGAGMGGGGDQYREEPGPESLLSGERVSDVRGGLSLSGQVLDKVEQRLGVKTDKLNDLAHTISGIESSYGENLFNPTSTAKGIYQFTDDSFETAKQRLSNVLGFLPDRIKNVPTVDKLLADDQKALFFAHLSENTKGFRDGGGSDKRMIEYIKGDSSGESLYINDHYKGTPDKATQKLIDKFFNTEGEVSSLTSGLKPTLVNRSKPRLSDKFSFYLDDDQFGARYSDSPFSANINVRQGGKTNWGAQVGGGTGLLNANVGIMGQGTSGYVSPYVDFNVNPSSGLNFNLHGQSYPGGYRELNPSVSYQNKTPWGSVDYNIGRQGGRTAGGFNVRGKF